MLDIILLALLGATVAQEDVKQMDGRMDVVSTLSEGTYLLSRHLAGNISSVKHPLIHDASKQKLKIFDDYQLRIKRVDVFSDQTVALFSTEESKKKNKINCFIS